MKQKILPFLRFVYNNFAPLLVFYGVNHFYGLKPAIAVSAVFSILETAFKVHRGEPITGLFKVTALMTLVFGAVDLYAQHSFLFKYESTVTNIFMGVFFGSSIFSNRTVIQEYYQSTKDPKPMTPDRVAYFRLLTMAWVLYFFAKAGAYFWVASNFSLEQGLVIRALLGSASLYAMLFLSIVGSKKLFPVLKKWGVLPAAESVSG